MEFKGCHRQFPSEKVTAPLEGQSARSQNNPIPLLISPDSRNNSSENTGIPPHSVNVAQWLGSAKAPTDILTAAAIQETHSHCERREPTWQEM